MAIWTSRYSNKELLVGSYYPVGISIGKPRFRLEYVLREQCYSLAPKGYMLNMDIDQFKQAYYEKLEEIGKEKIIDIVKKLDEKARNEGKELVLLCFEDVRVEGDWCHRTIFAEWWAENVGDVIEELPNPVPPKIKRKTNNIKEPAKGRTQENSEWKQMSLSDCGMAGIKHNTRN